MLSLGYYQVLLCLSWDSYSQKHKTKQTPVGSKGKRNSKKVYNNHSPVVLGGEGLPEWLWWWATRDECGRSQRGGQQTQLHCFLLPIDNKGKGTCYFRSSCQDRRLKWSWGTFSIFFLTDDTSPRSLNGGATPRFPGSALHSFQGLCIALTCLSLGRSFRQEHKNGSRKSRLWDVLAIWPSGRPTSDGYSASMLLVHGSRTRCPIGLTSPRRTASQKPQVVLRGSLKAHKCLKLRIFSPIHRSHPVDLTHLTLIMRNRFCGQTPVQTPNCH